jgi:NAD-dependent DNA ligase
VYDRLDEQLHNQIVGYTGGKKKHAYQLYSLEKFYVGEKLPNRRFLDSVETPKLDGANISAVFVNGELIQVVTRGDGIQGEDITNKFVSDGFCGFPISIAGHIGVLQVTFEVCAYKTVPNSRNYASGALNLKDAEEFYTRELYYIAHTVQGDVCKTFKEDMKYLHDKGFTTILCHPDFNDFPQDGRVVRENNNKLFEEFGYTQHHPRGAYAIKERKEGVVTKLLDVTWQVGRGGKVTPVAELEPCNIDGATVSRATLHNIAYIEALELDIGCMVEVQRMGEIIPGVIRKVEM